MALHHKHARGIHRIKKKKKGLLFPYREGRLLPLHPAATIINPASAITDGLENGGWIQVPIDPFLIRVQVPHKIWAQVYVTDFCVEVLNAFFFFKDKQSI